MGPHSFFKGVQGLRVPGHDRGWPPRSATLHPSGPFSGPSVPGDPPSGLSDPGDPASEFVAMAIYLQVSAQALDQTPQN